MAQHQRHRGRGPARSQLPARYIARFAPKPYIFLRGFALAR
jgi:hypothetical protein